MSESTSSINASRKTRSKQKKNIKKKLTKEEAEAILQKLIDLKVNSPKVEALKEHLEIITKWEKESSKYCEEWENEGSSPNDQNLDQLKALISQSKTFRYKVKLVYKVQDKLDLLEWRDEAQETLKELQSSKCNISLEDITKLISECLKKGFADSKEMKELQNLLEKVNLYKQKALSILEVMESSDEESEKESKIQQSDENSSSKEGISDRRISIESNLNDSDTSWNKKNYYKDKIIIQDTEINKVKDIIKEGKELNLNLIIVDILESEIEEIEEWLTESKTILDPTRNKDFKFKIVEELYEDSKELRIKHKEIKKVQDALYPIIAWEKEASKFIEKLNSKPKGKGKKKVDPLGKKILDAPTKEDKKSALTPYEILTKLPLFFEETQEDVKMEVEETKEETKEKEPTPDVEMVPDREEFKEKEKAKDDHDIICAPKIKNPTFRVRKICKSRDMGLEVDNLLDETSRNLKFNNILVDSSIEKIFKIEQTKAGDRDAKSEGDIEMNNKKSLEPHTKKPMQPYKEIDELFDEKGRIRYNTPVTKTFDKELNEKLESLMKDFRGRARKSKKEQEETKQNKNLECNTLTRNSLSPSKKYWLKFDKIEQLYKKITDLRNVCESWKARCIEIIIFGAQHGHDKYLFGDVPQQDLDQENIIGKIPESIIAGAASQINMNYGKKDQQGSIPIIYDPDIIKILQSHVDKLNWMKKLTSMFKANKLNTANPNVVKYKRIDMLDKEGKKFKNEDKLLQKLFKDRTDVPKLTPSVILNRVQTEFNSVFAHTQKWMERLDEMRNSEDEESKEDNKNINDDDLWTMPELEELINLGKDLKIIPTEYQDVKKIYKVAKDWKERVLALFNGHPMSIPKQIQDSTIKTTPINIELDTLIELLEETNSEKFEVELPEISLIQQLISLAQCWQKKAKKMIDGFSPYLISYDYTEVEKVREQLIQNHELKKSKKKRDKKNESKIEEEKSMAAPTKQDNKSEHTPELKSPLELLERVEVKSCDSGKGSPKSSSKSVSSSDSILVASVLGSSTLFDYSEDIFCHCCTPNQSDSAYIGCDICDGWFHYDCIGIDTNTEIDKYECKTCSILNNRKYSAVKYQTKPFGFAHLSEAEQQELAPKYDKFLMQAPVKMEEYDILFNIFWRVKLWRMQARIYISKGVNFAEIRKLQKESEKDESSNILVEKEKKLQKMINECEIFPFPVQEKDELINLLKEIKYVRNVFNQNE
ncbi:unnamed protein product [Moneuplotes crassus]|uniref:PHD-type domain-containing protein n=3 Tax=Euplotes crassus TaxID=5936 RepID=A0AAD2DC05_EUPCR|nr:unnamed protein product [Moneuplotes crassus]